MRVRAPGRDLACDVDVVLDRDRHAQQRPRLPRPPPGICLIGLQARALREYDPERVQERVKALDAREVEVEQLPCGELAGGDQLRLAGDPGVSELGGIHRRANLRQNAARTAAGQPPLPEPWAKRRTRTEASSRSDGRRRETADSRRKAPVESPAPAAAESAAPG